ncbi:MAG: winged helix-turn-helix domain-containing protein, partial [Paracoccaceae bacterium]|nr:winged helix-turn-helix domain-containing protein [Paracoccaceae bacterium]
MILRFSDCELDTDRQVLSRDGAPVKIEPQVYDLLKLLAQSPDRLITWDEIVENVWQGRAVSDSAISARVAAARKAVGDDGKQQAVIRTVARRGLEMVAAVEVVTTAKPNADQGRGSVRYTLNREGRSLAYSLIGNGPPLLRIAAVPLDMEVENTIPSLRDFTGILAQNFHYLRYDPMGFGLSDRDDDDHDFANGAEDALAVAKAVGW